MTPSIWGRLGFIMDRQNHPGGSKKHARSTCGTKQTKLELIFLKRLVVSPHVVYSKILLPHVVLDLTGAVWVWALFFTLNYDQGVPTEPPKRPRSRPGPHPIPSTKRPGSHRPRPRPSPKHARARPPGGGTLFTPAVFPPRGRTSPK